MISIKGQHQFRARILAVTLVALAAGLMMLAGSAPARAAWGTPVLGNAPTGVATGPVVFSGQLVPAE